MSWPLSLNIISYKSVLQSHFSKVYINIVNNKTELGLIPSIYFQTTIIQQLTPLIGFDHNQKG